MSAATRSRPRRGLRFASDREVVELWRCARCGAWSTAAHKPRYHLARVREVLPGDVVTKPALDPDDDWRGDLPVGSPLREPGWSLAQIRCGPFEEYLCYGPVGGARHAQRGQKAL